MELCGGRGDARAIAASKQLSEGWIARRAVGDSNLSRIGGFLWSVLIEEAARETDPAAAIG